MSVNRLSELHQDGNMESFNILMIIIGIANVVVGISTLVYYAFSRKKLQKKQRFFCVFLGSVFVISGVAQLLTVIC